METEKLTMKVDFTAPIKKHSYKGVYDEITSEEQNVTWGKTVYDLPPTNKTAIITKKL